MKQEAIERKNEQEKHDEILARQIPESHDHEHERVEKWVAMMSEKNVKMYITNGYSANMLTRAQT